MTEPSSASPGDVFARERQEHIARIVEEHGRIRVNELAARFGVSAVTVTPIGDPAALTTSLIFSSERWMPSVEWTK